MSDRRFILITDSTVDMPASYFDEHEIEHVCLSYTIEGQSYPDSFANEAEYSAFYDKMRAGAHSMTSQVNADQFTQLLEPYLKQGRDILYLCFSSGLSSTYNSAEIAKADLLEKYPDAHIAIIDSLCASMGEGLFLHYAEQKADSGATLDETVAYLEELKLKVCHWFTVEDLIYLKRGGRVSAAAQLVGSLLSIKPVLHVDNDGHLIPVKKVRGRKASLSALVDMMAQTAINPGEQTVFISHADSIDDANFVANQVRERFGTSDIRINQIGPVIGSHCGPGTMALFFIGEHR